MNTLIVRLHGTHATKRLDKAMQTVHSLQTAGVFIFANHRSDYYLEFKGLKTNRYGYGGGPKELILRGSDARLIHRKRKFPPISISGELTLNFDIVNMKAYVINQDILDEKGNQLEIIDPLPMRIVKSSTEPYKEETIVNPVTRYYSLPDKDNQYDPTYRSIKGDLAMEKLSQYTKESLLPG